MSRLFPLHPAPAIAAWLLLLGAGIVLQPANWERSMAAYTICLVIIYVNANVLALALKALSRGDES